MSGRHPGRPSSYREPILPRSFHLPVAVTDGSRTRNLNKNGVRFWTDCIGQREMMTNSVIVV
jgi:hypothetical protein